MGSSMQRLLARLSSLEETVKQTKADVAAAEERAARAEARATRLEYATGNIAAAVVNPKAISRRNLLMKAAGVGAAGVAGSLLLNRPKDAYAVFTWQGGAANAADLPTTVTSNAGFPAGYVLQLNANQGANPATNIDGIQAYGSNAFSGIAAYGGNNGGTGHYGGGGPATGTGRGGYGAYLFGGSAAAGQFGGIGVRAFSGANPPGANSWAFYGQGSGASDGTAAGHGALIQAGGAGYGLWAIGGAGTVATPHINGGVAVYGYGGPSNTAAFFIGDAFNANPAAEAHGVAGFGNALGVGGWFQGGRALMALGKTGTAGPPTTNQHFNGDLILDANFVFWVCTADGIPGTWEPIQPGGINNYLYTAVSTQQYTLSNSDGSTWTTMDATNLKLTITPNFNCQAILNGSADLWTANATFNQDIGIMVTGGAYPTTTGQPEGWKESGGFAGTFSPNAAAVETIVPLVAGTPYTVTLVWKTNHSGTSTIAAGAGPIGGKFSPTRLSARLVATRPGGTIPQMPSQPYKLPVSIMTHEEPPLIKR